MSFIRRLFSCAGILLHANSVLGKKVSDRRRSEDQWKEKKSAAVIREDALRDRFLADTVPLIIWTARPDGGVDYYNKAWFDYTRLTPAESVESGWSAVLHPEDFQPTIDRWTHSVATGTIYELECRLKRAEDGAYRWFIVRAAARRGEGGEILQWVGSCTDIDDQKRAEDELRRTQSELESRVAERVAELAKTNEALQRQQTELRVLFDLMPAMICFKDTQNRILRVNRRLAESFGTSVEALEGKSTLEIYPSGAAKFYADDLEVIHSATPRTGIIETVRDRDGNERWIQTDRVPVPDQDGQVIGIVVMVQDITERKRAEEASRESEERYRALIEWSPESISVHRGGTLLFVNPALVKMMGATSAQDLVGKPIIDWVHPDFRQIVRDRIKNDAGVLPTIEEKFLKFDGAVIDVEVCSRSIIYEGESALYSSIRDVTARKRIEEALRESEERFSDAFEYAPIGMALASPAGRWLKVNQAFCDLIGYSEAGLLTRTFQDITPPEDTEVSAENARRLLAGETDSSQMEKRYVHAQGHLVTVLLNTSLVRDRQGEPLYFIAHIQDITERKRTEGALRESEKRFRGTFEQAAVGIAHVSREGHFLRVNDKLCGIVGFERAELLGMKFADLTLPEAQAASEEARRAMLAGAQPSYTSEKRYLRKDGEVVWINLVTAPERTAHGELEYFISVFEDITKRKQMEDALRESDQKFRQLADSIDDVFWIGSRDFHQLHYLSPAFETIWGRPVESLYANPLQWVDFILPEDRGRALAAFATLMDGAPSFDIEYRIVRPGGEIRWVRVRGFQVRDAEDQLFRFSGIVTDITARKRAEEELFQSRETLRGILDHIPQRVFWKDRDLVYIGCNLAFARDMGFSDPSEVIGKTDFQASWKALAEIYRADDRSVIDLDAPKASFDEPAIDASGRPMWIRTSKVPLHDLEGRVTSVLGTYEDVTAHKLAKLEIERLNVDLERRVQERTEELSLAIEEAERANRAKSEFLSRTSHELRTPMNAILGFGQLLEMEEDLGPESRDFVDQLLVAGRRLMTLIDEVLDISRAESESPVLALESVPVAQVVEETLRPVRTLGAAFQVALEIAPVESGWSVLVDSARLGKALFHLLSNAIKYNRPGGKVILEFALLESADPPAFRFRVKDTGPGIAAENLGRLFTPFDRLDAERTHTHVSGAGLGLAISRRHVELMGGRVGVESVVGEGSVFWIEVPLAKIPVAKPDQSAPPSLRRPRPAIRDSKTLLYIEEDLSNLRLITRILARRPAVRLVSAEPGAPALAMAREYLPGLIMLDLHSPDSHGHQMLALLQADPLTSDIPVVILCAAGVPAEREPMLSAGASLFLTKPVAVRALLGALDQYIESGL